ncbi:MAG: DUF4276 family protein [Roseburia sp.]|nr:DUF4276 family protein [Roseburia sp.]
MRIGVTGEGPTDYGRYDFKTGNWEWGPVAAYIKAIANRKGKDIELNPIEREEVQRFKLQKRSMAGLKGKSIPARKFAMLIKREGYDAGIYYCDSDREVGAANSDFKKAVRHYEELYEEIQIGLEPVKAIPMIAMRMIECWLMSDKKALEIFFKTKFDEKVIPVQPEMMWGDKHNPNSNYPKHYFNRMVRESNKRYKDYESNACDFYNIANLADVEVLQKKCNVSFGRFYTDLIDML